MNIFVVEFIFPTFFLSKLFSNFFFQIFFPTYFQNFFFGGFTLDAFPFAEIKRTLCICVMKNMIRKRSKLDLSLVWLFFGSSHLFTSPAHITLDVKSLIPSPQRIDPIIFFSESVIFNWSTQMFYRWYLIAKCIKFWLEVDTPIFLYNHSEASVKFVDFAN